LVIGAIAPPRVHAARVLRTPARSCTHRHENPQALDCKGDSLRAWHVARLMRMSWQDKQKEKTMTALTTTFAFNGPAATATRNSPLFPSTARTAKLAKNMVLFLASPFIGLAYAVLLPFVGIGMLLWIATEGLRKPAAATAERLEEPVAAAEAPAAVIEYTPAAAEEPQAHGIGGVAMLTLKLLAAPFAGLAFVIAMPFVALGALIWVAIRPAA
jgi:hypothetical protein